MLLSLRMIVWLAICGLSIASVFVTMGCNSDITPTKIDNGMAVFNIAKFGAVGRCPADDSIAIQKAIDSASKVKGIVWIPAGTYCVDNTLDMRSNVTIEGEGDYSIIKTTSEVDTIRFMGNPKNVIRNTVIRKIQVTGTGVPAKGLPSLIAMRQYVDSALVEDCLLTNSSYDAWFALKECTNITILNNRVVQTQDDGLNPGGAQGGAGTRNVLIKGNVIERATNDGIHVSINSHNVKVVNNTISKSGNGIGFFKSSDAIIEDNSISNCGTGMKVIMDPVSRIFIANNRIQNSKTDGIFIGNNSRCILMFSNTIDQFGNQAIIDNGSNIALHNSVGGQKNLSTGQFETILTPERTTAFMASCQDGRSTPTLERIKKILEKESQYSTLPTSQVLKSLDKLFLCRE